MRCRMWSVLQDLFTRKNTNRRKVKKTPKNPNRSKRYLTVNNGSNYWIVEDHPAEKRVVIYKNNPDGEVKVTEIPYKTLWLSHPDGRRYTEFGSWHKGNTVLIQTSDDRFIFVYDNISEFKLKSGDEPVKFVSKIGNNDSPYPYLIGKDNVYTMWNTGVAFCYPKEVFDLTKDIISQEMGSDGPCIPRTEAAGPIPGRSDIKLKELFSPCDCRWRGSTNCGNPCKKPNRKVQSKSPSKSPSKNTEKSVLN